MSGVASSPEADKRR